MWEADDVLSLKEQQKMRRFCWRTALIITLLALVGFFAGIVFLKESVLKHNFSPSRHVIIEQDPDTLEIYMWKDALGNVYTPNDLHVKLFPYTVTALVLIIMGIAMGAYHILKEHYLAMLLINRLGSPPSKNPDPLLGARSR
ncbi:MAG: hypothetical protein C4589_07070 [Peptococcaceae bacterium]|nr:MAG: hypothetical protein C4589_07070 [Peptococcaceae bacterium]